MVAATRRDGQAGATAQRTDEPGSQGTCADDDGDARARNNECPRWAATGGPSLCIAARSLSIPRPSDLRAATTTKKGAGPKPRPLLGEEHPGAYGSRVT